MGSASDRGSHPVRLNALVLALALAVSACLAGCEDEEPLAPPDAAAAPPRDGGADVAASSPDGGAGSGDARPAGDAPPAAVVIECFDGTPTTHEQFLNTCWAETVTVVVGKPIKLPGGLKVGGALPPPP